MLKNDRKIIKIMSVVLISMFLLFTISGVVSAQYNVPTGVSSELSGKTTSVAGIVLGVIQAIGTAVAVIILVWLGVKYIMASPDGKAEIKKQAFAYIMGAVLLFGASWLVPLIQGVIDGASTSV